MLCALAGLYNCSYRRTPLKKKILIIVENLPVPFDSRVWKEAVSLRKAGYEVTVFWPRSKKYRRNSMKFLMECTSTVIRFPQEGNTALDICGNMAALCFGSSYVVDFLDARVPGYSGMQSSGQYFSGGASVQALRS